MDGVASLAVLLSLLFYTGQDTYVHLRYVFQSEHQCEDLCELFAKIKLGDSRQFLWWSMVYARDLRSLSVDRSLHRSIQPTSSRAHLQKSPEFTPQSSSFLYSCSALSLRSVLPFFD